MTRATLWVLLPACIVGALFLVSQGVPQNFKPYTTANSSTRKRCRPPAATARQPRRSSREQTIAQGPVASQEVIKELGTNGGGFFNANSAHPFENPTPLTNFFELVLIFAIGSGLTYTLGQMTGSPRHGWAVWCAMAILVPGRRHGGVFGRSARKSAFSEPRQSYSNRSRQHGRQRSPLWHRELGALGRRNHGYELRRGELDARFLHSAGRNDSAHQHAC